MGSSENFCLRWNDFEANVSGAFRDLRAESDFFDVTLGCSDSNGRSLQAHKVILSACSSFFKGMLRQQATHNPAHPHPYIYLRGVSFCDLSSVLDFMYHGEVNVAQEDLNSFLAVAEELQIKGLTNKDGEASKAKPSTSRGKSSSDTPGPPAKRVRKSSPVPSASNNTSSAAAGAATSAGDDVKQVVDIKSDPEAGPSSSGGQAVTDFAEESGDYGDDYSGGDYGGYDDNGEGGDMMGGAGDVSVEGGEESGGGKGLLSRAKANEQIIEFPDGRCRCKLCDKIFKSLVTAQKHVEVQHTIQKKVRCTICQRVLNNKYCFRTHVNLKHKIFGRDIVRCYGSYVEDDEADGVMYPQIEILPDSDFGDSSDFNPQFNSDFNPELNSSPGGAGRGFDTQALKRSLNAAAAAGFDPSVFKQSFMKMD